MSIIDILRKINAEEAALLWGVLLAILIPGGLTLLLHNQSLFIELSLEKIGGLAAAYTLPVIVLNFVVMSGVVKPSIGGSTLIDAMAMSCIASYPSLLITFIFGLSYKGHLAAFLAFQYLVFLFIWLLHKNEG